MHKKYITNKGQSLDLEFLLLDEHYHIIDSIEDKDAIKYASIKPDMSYLPNNLSKIINIDPISNFQNLLYLNIRFAYLDFKSLDVLKKT